MTHPANKPIVSVIIPCLNEADYITPLLKSLKAQQTPTPFEVIIVDGNSQDDTCRIIAAFKQHLPQLTLIRLKQNNVSLQRNRGITKARGTIIAGTDADCILPANWIESIYQHFLQHPNDIGLVGTFKFLDKSPWFNRIAKLAIICSDYLHRIISGSHAFRGSNYALKKTVWQKTGGFHPNISSLEDVELSLRVAQLGNITYLPRLTITTSYRRHKNRFFAQLFLRLKAYYLRVIKKDTNQDVYWEPIR